MKELEEATITDFHGAGTAIYCPCCSATNLTKEILENNSIFVCCMCNSEINVNLSFYVNRVKERQLEEKREKLADSVKTAEKYGFSVKEIEYCEQGKYKSIEFSHISGELRLWYSFGNNPGVTIACNDPEFSIHNRKTLEEAVFAFLAKIAFFQNTLRKLKPFTEFAFETLKTEQKKR